jgi:tRNA dimethylallyltransferase
MSTDRSSARAERPPLALIAGPTASGKSDLAVRLALALEDSGRAACVINADSAQVYADLAVLSARPTEIEMQGVPHRLFGEWDGAKACSAADWAAQARDLVIAVQAAGGVPIVVGGTGLYLRTLLDGIAPIPPIDPAVRAEVRALPAPEAYIALQAADPERAALLSPNDTTRIARALEVVRSSGRPLAHWQHQRSGGIVETVAVDAAVLLPDRQWLYERCDRRFAQMLERGATDEVETLLARRLDPDLPVMRAIGVPEIGAFLRGELSRADMIARGARATRNYAKRQFTWFRHQSPEAWTRIESSDCVLWDIFVSLFQH